jgi:peptidoglycan hydrolase CwlO-like protein
MMHWVLAVTFAQAAFVANAADAKTNPIEKVIEMLGDLQQKIIGEGQASQKVYDEFAEWCEEESKTLQFEIKTGKAEAEELTAVIEKAKSDIAGFDEKIEELSSTLSTDEADLKAATDIREKEHKLFVTEEAELVDTVDILERAIGILEREMAKNPAAALVQIQSAGDLANVLKTLVSATGISSSDASRLTALIQGQSRETSLAEDAAEEGVGAPDPAVYKNHGGGIIEVLSDLLADAQGQLAETRKKEMDSQHNFNVMELEIKDAIKFGKKQLDKTQKSKAAAGETQATAEGDLAVTSKALSEDIKQLADTHHDCMTKAQDFELEMKSRAEELKALAEAKKIITEMTGGATSQTYSFLQVTAQSRLKTGADLANFEAVRKVEALARRLGSTALAQLAQRMDAAARLSGASGDDPFAKVKGLISDMIEYLLKEAEADAAHKGYCDKEMSETEQKKADLEAEIEKLNTKIDKMSADSAKLKEEIAVLSKELADLAKSQAEMDKIRQEELAAYKVNKAEMEEGLEGIKLALKVLREYYASEDKAHAAATGAGGGIIAMLEVIESDFSKGLAELIATEETAAAEYDKLTKENEIAKTTKEQDVKYKTKESKSLDKAVAEATSDKAGSQEELDAVLKYYDSLKEQCIEKVEPYEERKKRREAEIAGLKDALAILEGEAVLLQRDSTKKLRGIHAHQQ